MQIALCAADSALAAAARALSRLCGDAWRRAGLHLAQWADDLDDVAHGADEDLPNDPLEQAWIVASAVEAEVDRRLGRHCTPRAVAEELARAVPMRPHTRLLDPACGAGALLLGGLGTARAGGTPLDPAQVVGADVDPVSVAITEAVVWLAAGRPSKPVGTFKVRDAVLDGLPDAADGAVILANPPWGVPVQVAALAAWRERVGRDCADLLEGEINIYTLFLLEALGTGAHRAGFITPMHWLHRRSLASMRAALARLGRLESVTLLRKRVFTRAPDMIPVLTTWAGRPHAGRIVLRRSGFRAPIPLPAPIPVAETAEVGHHEWLALPYAVFPLLRSDKLAPLSALLTAPVPRLSDPERPLAERLVHLGDGIYKSRVRDHIDPRGEGPPIISRARQTGRYRLDWPEERLTSTGLGALTDGECRRTARPKVLLHALKKAASPWRLSAALDDGSRGPLAATNNFLLLVRQSYRGDLRYPLVLLNSRLFNRLYTEHFPGVNIEAYTLGLLPVPWPPADVGVAPPTSANLADWLAWPSRQGANAFELTRTVYHWLVCAGAALVGRRGVDDALDHRVEAVVCGLLGCSDQVLAELFDS